MDYIQDRVFSDFEVPSTSDGSYKGRKNIADRTKEHYDVKFNEELVKVNQRLKSSKTKVSLKATGGIIQLISTLPLKPGDTHKQGKPTKQYTISLGIPANFDGLKTAEEEAHELGKLIARQTFIWTDKYLGKQSQTKNNITFSEFYDDLEKRYFQTRKKTIKSQNTFSGLKKRYKLFFLSDDVISKSSLVDKIQKSNTPSQRKMCIECANFIVKELGIDIDLNFLKIRIEKQERNIPTDNDVVHIFNTFCHFIKRDASTKRQAVECHKRVKLIYALLAIYGLRPREIFNQPDLDWLISPENKHNTFKVHESNKTGYREVFPFVPEWIELFDLHNKENIEFIKKYVSEVEDYKSLESKVSNVSHCFIRYSFGFKPYDLRHACAIRAHLQGIPVKAAADNLGHTVEMHTKVYQRWFGLENRRKAFNQAFEEKNENEKLKDENTQLKKRIAELELEVYKLRCSH
ncbi:site-specific integrase [Rivularia sp. UHCC 0363]|uniref:site-specific integrase n=1 Tax=Rivularia sp. UHCC 0363 TaxID=3110244 RepID=UPI002B1F214C|nr:site-specific integrase [Rivularia sp. UHCC 0363]MEA5593305.1 site-specific integrase [Rivularia sp. UHCC 0363]